MCKKSKHKKFKKRKSRSVPQSLGLTTFSVSPAMRDFCVANNNNTKMAELKFEAPLAQFEEADEWGPVDFQSSLPQTNPIDSLNYLNNLKENMLVIDNNNTIDNLKVNAANITNNNINKLLTKDNIDNFNEASSFSGSLEDLVNTFDEKITKCFGNYEQSVEELAPVQVRSQEEIMNECQ